METQHEPDEEQQVLLNDSGGKDSTFERDTTPSQVLTANVLRIIFELLMVVTLVVLLLRPIPRTVRKLSPVPEFPLKSYTFAEDSKYLEEDMFSSEAATLSTLHNWIELSADGRGYVQVSESESSHLGLPYKQNVNATTTVDVYMLSVFHQLHCLSYIAQNYQAAFGERKLSRDIAHHSVHCFDYLRQAIMCAADTSLEGDTGTPGWGSKHLCKDYSMVLDWANEHTAYRWRNGLLPEDSVL